MAARLEVRFFPSFLPLLHHFIHLMYRWRPSGIFFLSSFLLQMMVVTSFKLTKLGTQWLQANLFLPKGFGALAVNRNDSAELPVPLTWDQVVCPWMILFSFLCIITFLSLICLVCFLIIYIFERNLLHFQSLILLCSSRLPVFSAVQHHLTLL